MEQVSAVKLSVDEHPNVKAAVGQLSSLLVPTETLEGFAVQRRLFALTHRRTVVGITSGRLIVMSRGLFGGFNPSDIRWQDLKDVSMSAGIFGARLIFAALNSGDLAMSSQPARVLTIAGLRKEEAQSVYRYCQAQEQAWREKRRVRELEELRARSGGIHVASPQSVTGMVSPPPASPAPSSEVVSIPSDDPVARLQRAKEMHEKGLITDSEFESVKAKIISGL